MESYTHARLCKPTQSPCQYASWCSSIDPWRKTQPLQLVQGLHVGSYMFCRIRSKTLYKIRLKSVTAGIPRSWSLADCCHCHSTRACIWFHRKLGGAPRPARMQHSCRSTLLRHFSFERFCRHRCACWFRKVGVSSYSIYCIRAPLQKWLL